MRHQHKVSAIPSRGGRAKGWLTRVGRGPWRAAAISLALHLVVGLAAALLPVASFIVAPPEGAVEIEIVAPSEVPRREAAPARPEPRAAEPEATPRPAEPSGAPRAEPDTTMRRASRLFSAKILADPRSREARRLMANLVSDERVAQLCNVEALEQIHQSDPAFDPDYLVAYAMADMVLTGSVLQADGGAFRSGHRWYRVRYRCEVTPDLSAVVAFEFRVGQEIPQSQWEEHNLVAADAAE